MDFEKILLHVKAHVAVVDTSHKVLYNNQEVRELTRIVNPVLVKAVDEAFLSKSDFDDVAIRIPYPGLSEKEGLYDLVVSGSYLESDGRPLIVLTSMKVSRFMSDDVFADVDINKLMRELELKMRDKVSPRTILNFVLGSADGKIETDPNMLDDVLTALLDNAVCNTSAGSVTYGYELWPDAVYFFVKSTGGGMTTQRRSALLGNGTIDPRDRWFAECRLKISSVGGESGVDSAGEGKGVLYWFTLPDKTQVNDIPMMVEPSQTSSETPQSFTKQPISAGERKKILVAEDNESNYFLISSILEDDYDVIHAHDGREALSLWEEVKPDLILMDINMPYLDGYEATRRIRQTDANVPVIAVTAYAFASDRVRIMDSGFNSYVSKPVNADRLVSEIHRCLISR